jgi:hypothetical protein
MERIEDGDAISAADHRLAVQVNDRARSFAAALAIAE